MNCTYCGHKQLAHSGSCCKGGVGLCDCPGFQKTKPKRLKKPIKLVDERHPLWDVAHPPDEPILTGSKSVKDILEGLAPKELRLTEVELLKKDLVNANMQLALMKLQMLEKERDAFLAKVDPQGWLPKAEKNIRDATCAVNSAAHAAIDLTALIGTRLGVNLNEYEIDAEGRCIQPKQSS